MNHNLFLKFFALIALFFLEPTRNEPVIYFFHGIYGDATDFQTRSFHRYFEQAAKALNVSRFTDMSFDTDHTSFHSKVLVENFSRDTLPPPIYIAMGGRDEFGFQEGFELFKNKLTELDIPLNFYLNPEGRHNIHTQSGKEMFTFLISKMLKHQK